MNDRGIIKWAPFNSVINNKETLKKLEKNTSKIDLPVLSDEQKENIANNLINALYLHININIYYYENGYIKNINSQIKKIDSIYKNIYLQNGLILNFIQIIKLNF